MKLFHETIQSFCSSTGFYGPPFPGENNFYFSLIGLAGTVSYPVLKPCIVKNTMLKIIFIRKVDFRE